MAFGGLDRRVESRAGRFVFGSAEHLRDPGLGRGGLGAKPLNSPDAAGQPEQGG
jgi:hypothetical protein